MDLDLQLKSLNSHYKTVVKLDPLTWSGHKHGDSIYEHHELQPKFKFQQWS